MSRTFLVFDHVVDNLYLGNIFAATAASQEDLDGIRIDVVINATNSRYAERPGVEYHHVDVDDKKTANIAAHFDRVHDIVVASSGKNVLIHCLGGISRSVSLVLAILIRRGMTLREGLQLLKSKRRDAEAPPQPNPGFFRQLLEYEKAWLGCGSCSMTLEEYLSA